MLFSIYLASLITFSSVVHTQQNLQTLPQTVKIKAYRTVDNWQRGWLKQDEMGAFRYANKEDDGAVYHLTAVRSVNPGSNQSFYVGPLAPPPL
jgi:hypothetical protein